MTTTTATKPTQASTLPRTLFIIAVLLCFLGLAFSIDIGLFFLVLTTYALGASLFSVWKIISLLVSGSSDEEGSLESEAVRKRRDLVAKRDIKAKIVDELKFDYNLGRISDADYEMLRVPAVRDLIQATEEAESEEKEHRSLVEAELARRLRAEGIDTPETPEKAEKAEKIKEDKKLKEKAKQTKIASCASCAKEIDPDSLFCKHCGHRQTTGAKADA